MATDDISGTERKRDQIEGTRPGGSKESRCEKDEPDATAGEAPIDPADEAFIESNQKR